VAWSVSHAVRLWSRLCLADVLYVSMATSKFNNAYLETDDFRLRIDSRPGSLNGGRPVDKCDKAWSFATCSTVNHNIESWREQAHGYPPCGFIA
jgi:hypothetical protein